VNISELEMELRGRCVPEDAYSLGRDRDEAYCLCGGPGEWRVYYGERGNRNDERLHVAENSACSDLLTRLLRDDSVMSRLG